MTPAASVISFPPVVALADGKGTVSEIRDAVSARVRSLSVDLVADYLEACAEAKIIERA